MKNVEIEVQGDKLVIVVDLTKNFGKSKSGKTIIIGSSEGIQPVPDSEALVGVNVFKKP